MISVDDVRVALVFKSVVFVVDAVLIVVVFLPILGISPRLVCALPHSDPAGVGRTACESLAGTAQLFAHLLHKDLRRQGAESQVIDLEDYDPEDLATADAVDVFIMACYGTRSSIKC